MDVKIVVKARCCEYIRNHPLANLIDKNADGILCHSVSGVVDENSENSLAGARVAGLLKPVAILKQKMNNFDNFAVIPSYCLVKIPPELNPTDAAVCLKFGFPIYLALFHAAHAKRDDFVLTIVGDNVAFAILTAQICTQFGLKCIVWSLQQSSVLKDALAGIDTCKLIVADNYNVSRVVQLCQEESDGRLIDIVLDFDRTGALDRSSILSMLFPALGLGANWVTDCNDFQIQRADAQLLHLKSINLCALFDQAFILAPLQMGKCLHILQDLIKHLQNRTIGFDYSFVMPTFANIEEIHGSGQIPNFFLLI